VYCRVFYGKNRSKIIPGDWLIILIKFKETFLICPCSYGCQRIHHPNTFMANHPSTFFHRPGLAIFLRTSLSLGVHDHANKRKKSRPAIVRHGNKLNAFRVKVSMISLPKKNEELQTFHALEFIVPQNSTEGHRDMTTIWQSLS